MFKIIPEVVNIKHSLRVRQIRKVNSKPKKVGYNLPEADVTSLNLALTPSLNRLHPYMYSI